MECSTSKMKTLFLKVGIPLAVSLAAFVYARIIARRKCFATKPSDVDSGDEARCDGVNSTASSTRDDGDDEETNNRYLESFESSDFLVKVDVQEEMSGLGNRIEELQRRVWELETEFLQYQVMKEEESVLLELKNMLSLETARVEHLEKEIAAMEAMKQFFENLVAEYLRVLEQLELNKMENGLLQRKVKNLLRKNREQSRIIREKNLKIEAEEAEILRFLDMLETRNNVINKLEDEVGELRSTVNQLQKEKNELLVKLKSAENSDSLISKIGAKGVSVEDYNRLVKELEQLQKDRASEITELIHIKWTNACLRHELMRSQKQIEEKRNHFELELGGGSGKIEDCGRENPLDGPVLGPGETCSGAAAGNAQARSKKKKLLKKLKTWVEGCDSMKSKLDEKQKHESHCFGRLSVSEEAEEEQLFHSRRSYSSA